MSFVLVVVAAITLVIGLLQSGLAIIYVSIACSVLAGIVLATAVLRGRPEPRGASAPAPQRAPAAAPPASTPASWVAPGGAQAPSQAPEPQPVAAGSPAGGGVAVAERDDDRTQSFDRVEVEEFDPDDDFPIHGYDQLRATEILPMLAELSSDQLDAVEERERDNKSRAMVLKRIEVQRQARAAEERDEPAADDLGDLGTQGGTGDWDADDEGWSDAAPEPEPEPVAAGGPMSVRAVPGVGEFPIPDYDDLKALEVLGRLPDLSVTELHLVRRREEDGLRRAMVLNRIDRLIEEAPPEPEPVVVPPKRRASTKRAAARKAPAKRAAKKAPAFAAPAVDEPPAPSAPPAKRTRTAKSATAAPAKKAAAPRKAPAKRASASTSKAVTDPAAVAAKKAAATRKAGPAKRATKKR